MKLSQCTRCGLHKKRTNVVSGCGKSNLHIMFVGEAPGADEDKEGKPFVGSAGKHFARILKQLNLKRSDIYITNVVKCRPHEALSNRPPKDVEIDRCIIWLKKEIERVKPSLIVTLGGTALKALTGLGGVSNKRGRVFTGTVLNVENKKTIMIFPLYHPAVLLYDFKNKKPEYESDLKVLRRLLKELYER